MNGAISAAQMYRGKCGRGVRALRQSEAGDLANAMRRAEAAHGEHEKRVGAADPNWPDWHASYMVAEEAGTELPK